jgi:hypothetical protein
MLFSLLFSLMVSLLAAGSATPLSKQKAFFVKASQQENYGASSLMMMMATTDNETGIMDYKTDPYDMDLYENPSDTYVASSEVEQGTSISPGEFQKNTDYFIEGATTPIVLFCLGFVGLLLYNIGLCCGCCRVFAGKTGATPILSIIIFYAFLIVCFLSTHILYVGYSDVVDGLDIMRTSLDDVDEGFSGINDAVAGLQIEVDLLDTMCGTLNCSTSTDTLSKGLEYLTVCTTDDTGNIPNYVDDVSTGIDKMESFITLLMFVMYAFLMLAILTYILTEMCCKTKTAPAICCGNIAFVIVAFIGILWMVTTSVTADFCYENPTINTLNIVPGASKGQMYAVWYSSCYSGFNPLYRYVNYTFDGNQEVIDYVTLASMSNKEMILNQTEVIDQSINILETAVYDSCDPVQRGWFLLLNEALCGSFFEGVRVIWICEVAACISLFMLMITSAIIDNTAEAKVAAAAASEKDEAGKGQDLEMVDIHAHPVDKVADGDMGPVIA